METNVLDSTVIDLKTEGHISGQPLPKYNGFRIKEMSADAVYLVDNGYKRLIPDPTTYNNIFKDWSNIQLVIDIDSIPTGTDITTGALIGKGKHNDAVYLIDNKVKRHVLNPDIMHKYNFKESGLDQLDILIEFIPTGAEIAD